MTNENDDRRGVLVPSFVVIIASALLTGAIGGLFAFVVDTREDVVRLETEVAVVKRDATSLAVVPAQLATLSEQMKQVQAGLTSVNAKLDEKRGR